MEFGKTQREMVQKHLHISLPHETNSLIDEDVTELRGMRNRAARASRDLLDSAQKERRDLTKEESDAFDTAKEYLNALDDAIEDLRTYGADTPHGEDFNTGTVDIGRYFRANRAGRIFENTFGRKPVRGLGGFKNTGDLLRAVYLDDRQRLQSVVDLERRTMTEGTGTEGGWAVPEETWAEVLEQVRIEGSIAMEFCTQFPLESESLKIPLWQDGTEGPIGRVAASRLGEAATATRVTPKTAFRKLTAHKYGIFCGLSSEVLEDSVAISKGIEPLMAKSVGFAMDEDVLSGNGIERCLGIVDHQATVAVSRASANSIGFTDLRSMLGRLLPTSLPFGIWIVSPSAFAHLVGLEISTNSGILAMSSTWGAGKLRLELLGREVRVSEKLKSIGTAGDILLVDLSYYALGLRSKARLERTNAAQWTEDIVDVRLITRCDGAPLTLAPHTPSGGGDTISPFVQLDA